METIKPESRLRGPRGEWYVAGQILLMALVFFGPRGDLSMPGLFRVVGGVCLALGIGLFASGFLQLGSNLTPLPKPKKDATLVTTGPYRIVRHPIYSGGSLVALGWAFWVLSWLTLGYAIVLFAYLDFKSRREERWLVAKYLDYREYQRRVHRLIPFLY